MSVVCKERAFLSCDCYVTTYTPLDVGSEFRVRGEVRHERVQGDRGSDMGTREMFNEGGVRWDGRVAFQTYSLTNERSG